VETTMLGVFSKRARPISWETCFVICYQAELMRIHYSLSTRCNNMRTWIYLPSEVMGRRGHG